MGPQYITIIIYIICNINKSIESSLLIVILSA